MGSVYNRGTRNKPNWYARYKDADGTWKSVPSHQPTKAQARRYVEEIEARIAAGKVGIEQPTQLAKCGDLMRQWSDALVNRNATDDRNRMRLHLLPVFEAKTVPEITLAVVMSWIDQQRAAGKLSDGSIRHNLNLLSRFFSWAIERGHATVNPVRQIPQSKRPQQSQKRDVPWLEDDDIVRQLMADLPAPVNLMFYLGNRSGLRTGEIAGLRMADVEYLLDGVIRVRFSYDGPLKEDKGSRGKMKWVPAAADAVKILGAWIAQRRAEGAGAEDFLFPCARRQGSWFRKEYIEGCWQRVAQKHNLALTWYQATRHSFVTRSLKAGASLDEVSAAVGHSSPVVTRRYYDHHVRKIFSSTLRTAIADPAPRADSD